MAASSDELQCPAASWRMLPLSLHPTPIHDITMASVAEWARSTAAHSAGALAALLLALLLLLTFLVWRLVLCCRACFCPRRPRTPPSKGAADAARNILRGRVARWLKGAIALCALGVLGGCINGLTQVRTTLAAEALTLVHSGQALAEGIMGAGDSLMGGLADLENATLALSQQLETAGAGYAAATQPAQQALAETRDSLAGASSALGGLLSALGPATLGMLDQVEASYLPLVQTAETMLQSAMYLIFSLLAAFSLVTAAGAAASWPAMAKPALALLLLLTLLAWLLATVLTLLLRAGSDVCAGLEPLLLRLAGGGTIVSYYLLGPRSAGGTGNTGSTGILSLLSDTFGGNSGLGVEAVAAAANQTLADLQTSLQAWPPLAAAVVPAVDSVAAELDLLIVRVEELNAAASYEAVHPVFLAVKSMLCCSLLNDAGGLWAGLVAAGSCALALLLLAFVWMGRIDRLGGMQLFGCCHMHSARDWSLEGQHGEDGGGDGGTVAALQAKANAGKSSGGGTGALGAAAANKAAAGGSTLASPAAQIRIKSWTSDLASAPPSPPILKAASDSAGGCPPPVPPAALGAPATSPDAAGRLPPRSLSLPAARAVAGLDASFQPMSCWTPLEPVLEPTEAAADTWQQGHQATAEEGTSLVQEESSAPPLPMPGGEVSVEVLSGAARTAAELASQAFAVASRAHAMLGDASRIARSSMSGGQATEAQQAQQGDARPASTGGRSASAASSPPACQSSRIPRPYLNY